MPLVTVIFLIKHCYIFKNYSRTPIKNVEIMKLEGQHLANIMVTKTHQLILKLVGVHLKKKSMFS